MEEHFAITWESAIAICLTAIGVFTAIIIYTRLSGKRSFSKMSSFDFASTVALGSMFGSVILSKSITLLEGLVGIAALYFIQIIIARLRQNLILIL